MQPWTYRRAPGRMSLSQCALHWLNDILPGAVKFFNDILPGARLHFRVFTDEHGLFVYMCEILLFNHLLYTPYTPLSLNICFTCMPMRFATEWRVSDNRERPRLVCVHCYTAIFFLMGVYG